MRRQFQSAHCIHFKEERIGRFEGLPQFKWNDLGEQDVIGQGSFEAVFITKNQEQGRKVKTVVDKKSPAFNKDSRF